MTSKVVGAAPATDVTRSKAQLAAELSLGIALQRVADADAAVADTETARDAQLDLLRAGVADVSAGDLAHADAEVTRAVFLAVAARDQVPICQEAVRAADLVEAWDAASRFTKSECVVGWQQADQAAKDARIRADALRRAYVDGCQSIGQRIRSLGGPHVDSVTVDQGYRAHGVARDGSSTFVSVVGFRLHGRDYG